VEDRFLFFSHLVNVIGCGGARGRQVHISGEKCRGKKRGQVDNSETPLCHDSIE
jgi:hypothetical protein